MSPGQAGSFGLGGGVHGGWLGGVAVVVVASGSLVPGAGGCVVVPAAGGSAGGSGGGADGCPHHVPPQVAQLASAVHHVPGGAWAVQPPHLSPAPGRA